MDNRAFFVCTSSFSHHLFKKIFPNQGSTGCTLFVVVSLPPEKKNIDFFTNSTCVGGISLVRFVLWEYTFLYSPVNKVALTTQIVQPTTFGVPKKGYFFFFEQKEVTLGGRNPAYKFFFAHSCIFPPYTFGIQTNTHTHKKSGLVPSKTTFWGKNKRNITITVFYAYILFENIHWTSVQTGREKKKFTKKKKIFTITTTFSTFIFFQQYTHNNTFFFPTIKLSILAQTKKGRSRLVEKRKKKKTLKKNISSNKNYCSLWQTSSGKKR